MAADDRDTTIRRATRAAAIAFSVAIASAVGLVVVYVAGGHTQLEGLFLFAAFAGAAVGLVVWTKVLIAEPDLLEERPPMRSSDEDRAAFEHAYLEAREARDPDVASRRRFLSRLLAGAGASLALALGLPFFSLGAPPGGQLFRTNWARGSRVVDFAGRPVRAGMVGPGGVITVFPEGHTGDGQSAALLIGIEFDRIVEGGITAQTVPGIVCYSKVCTHAGCPVGLYREEVAELLCPCHQSKFAVYDNARPISGPTTRPLPQLPLGTDDAGFLVALGDFEAPVGPEFWNIERGGRA
ncbi:MAG: Rieske 2Fe-2S domain-containing protein [Actinomycetota bacterium]|nr:Rieske 2Fe-2S domain-containing protein [Actinomycetota bacterium]